AHLCESGEQFAFLVLGDNEGDLEERAYGLAQAAQYDVERNTERKLLVAIGNAVSDIADIPDSFADARVVMGKLDDKRAIPCIMNMQDVIANACFSLINLDVAPIAEQLRHAGPQDVDAILEHYVASMGESASQSMIMANYLVVDIWLASSRMI